MIAVLLARTSWASAGLLACIGMALASPQAARGAGAPLRATAAIETTTIPPGLEELFAAMLGRGAALPGGCAFTTGQIERTLVRGVYSCPDDEVVLELRHLSAAPADTARTEKIAIVTMRGTPPAALLAALEERIREREGAFEWPKTKRAQPTRKPGCMDLAPLPSFLDPYFPGCYPLFAAVLVGIAQITVMVLGLGYGLLQLYRTGRSPNAA